MWRTRRAISLHVALAVFVPGCVALTWWQVTRALGGNTLSWVYTFEWPLFAAYATFMWWKLVHDDPVSEAVSDPVSEVVSDPVSEANSEDEPDDDLAAYNRYLADLNASGRQKRW